MLADAHAHRRNSGHRCRRGGRLSGCRRGLRGGLGGRGRRWRRGLRCGSGPGPQQVNSDHRLGFVRPEQKMLGQLQAYGAPVGGNQGAGNIAGKSLRNGGPVSLDWPGKSQGQDPVFKLRGVGDRRRPNESETAISRLYIGPNRDRISGGCGGKYQQTHHQNDATKAHRHPPHFRE